MATKKSSNVNIFKFRVIVDTENDVFRDIEIETEANFEAFHRAILDAFDFESGEMASFYMSDESWEKGMEIPLMDMGGKEGGSSMNNTALRDQLSMPGQKVLYVYDFLRMWIFYVELVEVKKDAPSTIYPRVSLAYGDAPSQDDKEMDLFGSEFSEEEFNEFHGNANEEDEEDEFGSKDEFFDEDEFGGSIHSHDDY